MRIALEAAPYIKLPVTATTLDDVPLTISGDPVEWAFTVPGTRPTTWHTGIWAAGNAAIQIGFGVIPLAAGKWDVWLRITDDPEIIADKVGQITVY